MYVYLTEKRKVEVKTVAEASRAICLFWHHTGSSEFYADRKAGIIEKEGKAIAHVSYNGRVWEGTARFSLGNREITFSG